MNNKNTKNIHLRTIALTSILLIVFTTQVNAMGFLDFMKVYIFSEVDGVVLMEGKPVSGAKVVRTADFKDKIYTDTVVTDGEGKFHFDDISTFSMRLSETAILQKIVINHQEKEYLAWELLKRNDNHYGELNDPETSEKPIRMLNLTCELTENQDKKQVVNFKFGNKTIYGLSRWE